MTLLERLERAEGPDRELNNLIALAAGYTIAQRCMPRAPDTYYNPKRKYIGVAPRFTESIDAALSLVPEGKEWSLDNIEGYRAYIMWEHMSGEFIMRSGKGATPAIALCIAALKARPAPAEGE